MKFCSNCGKQMNDDERFCQACGADSAAQPQQAALARSFVFGGGNETTGIEGITIMGTDVQRHGTIEGIFDLQGRKISNPTKGIYIKNNKKVVIK